MPTMALGDVALWHQLYLAAKPSHMGVDVDELACPLHRPVACCHQMWGQGFLSSMVISHRVIVGGAISLGGEGREAPRHGYLMRTCVTESFVWSKSFLLGDAYPM
jgi:hypothetical protein